MGNLFILGVDMPEDDKLLRHVLGGVILAYGNRSALLKMGSCLDGELFNVLLFIVLANYCFVLHFNNNFNSVCMIIINNKED